MTRTAARPVALSSDQGESLTIVTDAVRVLADASTTSGALSVFEVTSQPNSGPPLHRHNVDDEYFFVLSGRFRFVRDGVEILAEPGAFVSCPRGSVHTFVCLGPAAGRLLVVTTPPGLEQPFREADRAAAAGTSTPQNLAAAFAKFNVEFLGPPLSP